MKRLRILVLVMVMMFSAGSVYAEEAKKAEEAKVTGSAAVGVFNKYVFRGYELSSHSFVTQPSVSVSYKGFSASLGATLTAM